MQRWERRDDVNPRTCDNCGAHLSKTFRRGYSDHNGTVHGCPECCTYAELNDQLVSAGDRGEQ